MNVRQLIGACYLPMSGPSRCAVCGDSPFASGRATGEVLGPNFADYDLLSAGQEPWTCQGCVGLLGGKPGSAPMPLRMGHFAVVNGELLRPSGQELSALLLDPPEGIQAVAWTASRQKHASLRCGPCSQAHLMIGTEGGTLAWDVAEGRILLGAVTALRHAARQEEILTGQYSPHVILALGPDWSPSDAIVTRYRPSLMLDVAVALVRRPDHTTPEVPAMPISDPYRRAGALALALGSASRIRARDPIPFWGIWFPRRLAAAAQRPSLLSAVGWLAEKIAANPSAAIVVVETIESMTAAETEECLRLWRETPLLVIAYARQIYREQHQETA